MTPPGREPRACEGGEEAAELDGRDAEEEEEEEAARAGGWARHRREGHSALRVERNLHAER